MNFEIIDSCPVPAALAPELREIKKRSGATLQSCDRSPEAEPLLAKLGKKSQRQLYAMFLAGTGNPANRPGQSTHERRNDAIAYAGPLGMPLRYWQVGMDWDIPHVAAVVRAAASLGFTATVTYPNSSGERQHTNFRKEPKLNLFKAIKPGQRDPRVPKLKRQLAYIHDPNTDKPYLPATFRQVRGRKHYGAGADFVQALKAFQYDHGQSPDGIYGRQTARQLATSVRFRTARLKAKKHA